MSPQLQALEDQVQNKVDWKYEMRREAQEILPGECSHASVAQHADCFSANPVPHPVAGLFIGPFQPSWKLATLQALGITHILCIAESREQ